MLERKRTYFGFELETEIETIESEPPSDLQSAARDVLAEALWQGETTHPEQGRLRRILAGLDELWRRSGGTLKEVSPEALRDRIRRQLEPIRTWNDFLTARVALNPGELVDDAVRTELEALPGRIHLRGDAVPLDYEIQNGEGVARVRLREGQAKRLRPDELPVLDRPLKFAVQRGRHPPLMADSVPELQSMLRRMPKTPDYEEMGDHRRARTPRERRRRQRRNHRGKRNRPRR